MAYVKLVRALSLGVSMLFTMVPVFAAELAPSPLLAIDQNRNTLIDRIVAEWSGALVKSNAGIDAAQLRALLGAMRADQLLAASLAGSLEGLRDVMATALSSGEKEVKSSLLQAKNLGDATADLTYTPVVPCRLFDSRSSQGGQGALPPGATRTYSATAPLPQQGGPGGCAAPAGAAAAMIQMVPISPTGPGLLQGGASGTGPFANALVLYQPGEVNGASIPMPVVVANGRFDLVAQFNAVEVAGDLLGYFRAPQGGFVKSVTAGAGLTGGTITSSGTIAVDTTTIQSRVTGTCAPGSSIRTINANGTVVCETDDGGGTGTVTSVASGTGLTGGPITTSGTLSADTTYLQRRVSTACATGSSIRAIAADGSVTCQTDGPANAFVQNGNAFGTTGVLGTTDNNALDVRVNGSRVMRFEPNAISPNVIGGSPANGVTAGVRGAMIGGGGLPAGNTDPDFNDEAPNRVTDVYGTVAGGYANTAGDGAGSVTDRGFATVSGGTVNTASGLASTVGGGSTNTATGTGSTVGGGLSNAAMGDAIAIAGGQGNIATGNTSALGGGAGNTASGELSVIGGGFHSIASGFVSTVGGGWNNIASGWYSAIAGGVSNSASGQASFAAGTLANADANGCFVWNDSSGGSVSCGGAVAGLNRVVMRGTGGFVFITHSSNSVGAQLLPGANAWSIYSDRHYKDNMRDVDATATLDRLIDLPIATWNWKSQDASVVHMGPTAQDFHAAFGLGETPTMINTVDVSGVALAAIKGLNAKLEAKVGEQAREIAELRRAVEVLMARTSPEGTIASR